MEKPSLLVVSRCSRSPMMTCGAQLKKGYEIILAQSGSLHCGLMTSRSLPIHSLEVSRASSIFCVMVCS